MQTVPCPHCAEPVRPTATFCLACDQPITDTERGLSVAEAVPASIGRPVVGLTIALVCLALLGGAVYGTVRILRHEHVATADEATNDVRKGLELVVSAEDGHDRACDALGPVVAPPARKTLEHCQAIVGDDRGAKLSKVSVSQPHLANGAGSVHVKATITDAHGTRALDETVRIVQVGRHWRMAWSGRPEAAANPT